MDKLQGLKQKFGNAVQIDRAVMLEQNTPWRYGKAHADYLAVVTLTEAADLQNLFQYCIKNDIKIIPRSGGTALTNGSSVGDTRAPGDYIILKQYHSENIRPPEILNGGKSVRVFPGNTTKDLNPKLAELGYTTPWDLGIGDKEGKAQILGNFATNARGSGAARKGSAGDAVTSMKVLMGDGKIYKIPAPKSLNSPSLDDVIGMGGTTGIILEAEFTTTPMPKKKQVAVIGIKNISQIYDLLDAVKSTIWQNVNLFERINNELFEYVVQFTKRQNLAATAAIRQLGNHDYLFIELATNNETSDLKKPLIEALKRTGLHQNSLIAESGEEGQFLLEYRIVNASIACEDYAKKFGGDVVAFDISVPPGDVDEFPSTKLIAEIEQKIPGIKIFSFGHAAGVQKISAGSPRGGTAIHFNPVVPLNCNLSTLKWLKNALFSEISTRKGTIISEHTPGIIQQKYVKEFMPELYDCDARKIGKWNPYNLLNADAYVLRADVIYEVKQRDK